MKDVEFAGGRFTTGDDVAEAVLAYASELANLGRAATLHVPVVEGEIRTMVELLVGPASQLMAHSSEHPGPEPDGSAFVAEVGTRIDQLRSGAAPVRVTSQLDWDT